MYVLKTDYTRLPYFSIMPATYCVHVRNVFASVRRTRLLVLSTNVITLNLNVFENIIKLENANQNNSHS